MRCAYIHRTGSCCSNATWDNQANLSHSKSCGVKVSQHDCTSRAAQNAPEPSKTNVGGEIALPEGAKQHPAPFQIGMQYKLSEQDLKKTFYDWHDDLYPAMLVVYNPSRPLAGFKVRNPYLYCRLKSGGFCDFRVLFHPLPDDKGYKVTKVGHEQVVPGHLGVSTVILTKYGCTFCIAVV